MKEVVVDRTSLLDIPQLLRDLKQSEVPVVLRACSALVTDEKFWFDFLSECGFVPDTRQFDYVHRLVRMSWWEISNQPDKADSYAFSTTAQPLHNDNAWFSDPAEVNFFLMVKQAPLGGRQIIYRSSRLLHDLNKLEPSLLSDLTDHVVVVKKGDTDLERRGTIISKEGRIAWNFYRTLRDSPETEELCNRFFRFLQSRVDSSSVEFIHAQSGDAFAFNDALVLHGRESFFATKARERVLLQSMWNLGTQG